MKSRRQFLRDGGLLAVSMALTAPSWSTSGFEQGTVSLDDLCQETFARLLNHRFQVGSRSRTKTELELVDVNNLSEVKSPRISPVDANWEHFSLIFHASAGKNLEQNTYAFEHADIGRFEMFLVPVRGADAGPPCYQAIFHRPRRGNNQISA